MADLSKLPVGMVLDEDPPDDLEIEEDDFLDHPNFFYGEEILVDEEEQELFAFFPEFRQREITQEEKDEWKALFEGDTSLRSLAPLTAAAYESGLPLTAGRYNGQGRDLGIADRLRAYGLKVVEVAGWKTRGSATFHPRGSVDHHTAAGRYGNTPSLNICTNGRSDLPGPLCQVLIGRDNTCYVIASGRANHAGSGSWRGVTGNSNMYGVERENTGTGSEPWREDQRVTAAKCHAALLDWRRDSSMVCQHKEWTSRKIDVWDQSGADMRNRISNVWKNGTKVDPAPTEEEDEMQVQMAWFKAEDGSGPHCYALFGLTGTWLPTHEVINIHRFVGIPWAGGTEDKSILDHNWWKGKAMMNGPLQNVGLIRSQHDALTEILKGTRTQLSTDKKVVAALDAIRAAVQEIEIPVAPGPGIEGDVHNTTTLDPQDFAEAVINEVVARFAGTA